MPRDISLIGFDDYTWMRARATPLTAIFQPVREMGRTLWDTLSARIKGDLSPAKHVLLAVRTQDSRVDRPCSRCASATGQAKAVAAPAGTAPADDSESSRILGRHLIQSSRINRSATCPSGKRWEVNEAMMKFSATRRALLAGAAFAAVLATGAFAADKPTMGVVVKIGGIPWFNAMETGIKEEGAKDGVDAFMIGPTSADPSLQVRAIEDLIAKKVNVIGVVPNDEKALEPVLAEGARGRDQGCRARGPGHPEQGLGLRARLGQGLRRGARGAAREDDGRQGRIRGLRRLADGSAPQRLGRRGDRLPEGQVSGHEAGRRPVRRR